MGTQNADEVGRRVCLPWSDVTCILAFLSNHLLVNFL
jgi:hypothetical protein